VGGPQLAGLSGSRDCPSTPSARSATRKNVSASLISSSASRADAARGSPASAAALLAALAAKNAAHSDKPGSACGSSSHTLRGRCRLLPAPGSTRAATIAAAALSAAHRDAHTAIDNAVDGLASAYTEAQPLLARIGKQARGYAHDSMDAVRQASGDLRVIKTGLEAEDWVVVNGLMRARAGQKVNPQEQSAAPTAAANGPQVKN